MKLGIDFGTSFSTMAYCNPVTGRPEVISDDSGLTKIPTLVYWGADGDIKVGQAVQDLLSDTECFPPEEQFEVRSRIIKSIKSLIGKDVVIPLPDGSVLVPKVVIAHYLGYLKNQAEKRIGHGNPFDEVTLTHPSSFTRAQKGVLEEAATDAGFTKVHLLEEPVSAALGYAYSNVDPGDSILVYDLGAGTFDLAYVAKDEEGEYRLPIPTMGDPDCGGDNFDLALYNYFERQLPDGQKFKEGVDELDLSVLFECRKLKESISKRDRAGFRIWTERLRFQKMVQRDEFEGLIKPFIEKSLNYLERMLKEIKAAGYNVGSLIMIGGSSRIPLIRKMLGERLNLVPIETSQDDVAVALGAAVDLDEIRQKREEARQQKKEKELLQFQKQEQERRHAEQEAMQQKLEQEKQALAVREEIRIREARDEEIRKAAHNMELAREAYGKGEFGEAIHRFKDAAEQGNPEAQFMLGTIYRDGKGIRSDMNKAVEWFEKSAKQDHVSAMYAAGMACLDFCVNKPSKANEWFELAVERGDVPSMLELGYSYKEGRGFLWSDRQKAIDLLRKAASTDITQNSAKELKDAVAVASYHYALLLESTGTSDCEVRKWMQRASDYGCWRADIWKGKKEAQKGLREMGKALKGLFG